jgi:hypothetical protein
MPGSGYNLKVLPSCWYALVAGMVGMEKIDIKELYDPPKEPADCRRKVENTIHELKRLLRRHWLCFGGYAVSGVQ